VDDSLGDTKVSFVLRVVRRDFGNLVVAAVWHRFVEVVHHQARSYWENWTVSNSSNWLDPTEVTSLFKVPCLAHQVIEHKSTIWWESRLKVWLVHLSQSFTKEEELGDHREIHVLQMWFSPVGCESFRYVRSLNYASWVQNKFLNTYLTTIIVDLLSTSEYECI
jgi:hypothetical protein